MPLRAALLASALALVLAAPTVAQAPAPAPSPAPAPAASSEVIYKDEATAILGRSVRDPAGDPVGRVTDVLVDETGQPRAAVIDTGGFLGVGNRRIAVVWRALHFAPTSDQGKILLEMSIDQIKAIPDYKPPSTAPSVVLAVPPTAPAAPKP